MHLPSAAEFIQIRIKEGLGAGRKDLTPVYAAVSEAKALDRFAEFSGKWEKRPRSHFPAGQAALKRLYLATMSLDPTRKGRKRWTNRWKAALNGFDITLTAA
jgi:putative transposase